MLNCRVAVTTIALAIAPVICFAQQPASPPSIGANRDCAGPATAPMDHSTMDHAAHAVALENCASRAIPTSAGQAAFGAISEVVRILKADPNTDWSKVNVEALRQHLIDMDDVTMHSIAKQRNILGGMEVDVTGAGPTIATIRRMMISHSADPHTRHHVAIARGEPVHKQ